MADHKRPNLITTPVELAVEMAKAQSEAFLAIVREQQPDPIRQWYSDNGIRLGDIRKG